MQIYVDFEIPDTIREFLRKFFSHKIIGRVGPVRTYSDERKTRTQCVSNKMRSFDEIYDLVTTYFPEAEKKEVLHVLLTLKVKDSAGTVMYPNFRRCSQIKRINFVYYCQDLNTNDIFSKNYDIYESKWSWKELFSELGINNLTEMKIYIKTNKEKEEDVNNNS